MNTLQKILLLADTFAMLAAGVLGPIYALYVAKIGGDLLDASMTFAVFMLTSGIVLFLIALWEDKTKNQRVFVVLGYGLMMLAYGGYLLVNSTWSLFLVNILLGLSVAFKDPAYDALFSSGKKHLAFLWGEWEADYYIMTGVGALIGGFIAKQFGFMLLLWVMFLLTVLSFILSLLLLNLKEKRS